MSDAIDRVPGPTSPRSAERVTAPASLNLRLRQEDDSGFSYEDRVEIDASRDLVGDILELSIAMIRALIAGELPEEAVQSLETYAPLGNLTDKEAQCDRVEQKGMETIPWPSTVTLAQALERAAN